MSELWQPWENLFLHEVGMSMPVHVIAEKLERSESAVTRQASRIGAPLIRKMTGRPWTAAELHLFGRFLGANALPRYPVSMLYNGRILTMW